MIIMEVARQNLIDDDQVVETLSPDTADDPFDKRILKRRPRGCDHLFDPHPFNAALEILAVNAVSIAQQIFGSQIIGKGFDDLLRRPFGGGIGRHVEMNDPPPVMKKNDETIEIAECEGRNREKIDAHQLLGMIIEKGLPSLRGRLGGLNPIFGDGPPGDVETEETKFRLDAWHSPQWILT